MFSPPVGPLLAQVLPVVRDPRAGGGKGQKKCVDILDGILLSQVGQRHLGIEILVSLYYCLQSNAPPPYPGTLPQTPEAEGRDFAP